MQLIAKAEHLARSNNEGRVYTKSTSAEFHRANKVTVYFHLYRRSGFCNYQLR